MSRVIHFELHVENPERAVKFYSGMFGWTIRKWDGPMEYWTIVTGEDSDRGINGGMVRRRGPAPVEMQAVNAYVCTLGVDDLDRKLEQLPRAGGSIALPKMVIPGLGWLAYAKDPEGNIFGMMQSDSNAK